MVSVSYLIHIFLCNSNSSVGPYMQLSTNLQTPVNSMWFQNTQSFPNHQYYSKLDSTTWPRKKAHKHLLSMSFFQMTLQCIQIFQAGVLFHLPMPCLLFLLTFYLRTTLMNQRLTFQLSVTYTLFLTQSKNA